MAQKIRHKRSGILNKKPNASQLELGEIAINFNAQNPFISTLTSDGTVAEFPSKEGVQGLIDDALGEYQPGSGGTVDAYTKDETDSLLSGKSDVNHEHSQYLTASDIEGKADKSELNNYLTTSAASSTYATKTDLNGKADSVHSHSYNDLTDKPVIPSIEGLETSQHASETYQPKGDYLTQTSADERYAQKGDTPTDVYTKSEVNDLLAGKSDSGHTHDQYLTEHQDISGKADKSELANYQPVSGMSAYSPTGHSHTSSDITDLSTVLEDYSTTSHTHPQYVTSGDVETMMSGKTNIWTGTLEQYQALEEKDNNTIYCITDTNYQYLTLEQAEELFQSASGMTDYQPVSGMSAYSQTGHTHNYNDLEDKPTIPSLEGLATKAELENYQPVSGMSAYSQTGHTHSEYSQTGHTHTSGDVTDLSTVLAGYSQTGHTHSEYSPTGHTHSEYLTQTSADSRYARVISISQSDYDTLVSNDQVQQGVLYCIIESSN